MHANLAVIGSHGDVLPFIALGVELRRRGHQVTIATAEPFAALARQQGLKFVPLVSAADFEELIGKADLWQPIEGTKRLMQSAMHLLRPTYDFAMRHHVRGETITVASTLAMGARIAQERHRLPLASVHLAPFLISSQFDPPRMPGLPMPKWLPSPVTGGILSAVDKYFLDEICQPVNAFRAKLDLPPVRNIARKWWHSTDRVIAMFPEWYCAPQRDWPRRTVQVDFPAADLFGDASALSAELQRFLDGGPAPVAFTFGSAMLHAGDLLRASLDLCRRADRRGIVIAPSRLDIPADLAERIIQVRYAPFSKLLPHCAALVHHGGIGTVARAMAAGIPQLLVPLAFDHFDEAARIEKLAVGVSVSRAKYAAARSGRVLETLLASARVRQNCIDLAARLQAADGIARACDIIERLPLRPD